MAMPVRAEPKMRADWEEGRRSFTTLHTMKSKGRRGGIESMWLYATSRDGGGNTDGELVYVVIGSMLPPAKLRALSRGALA